MKNRSAILASSLGFLAMLTLSIVVRVGNAGARVSESDFEENDAADGARLGEFDSNPAPKAASASDDLGTCRWEVAQGSLSTVATASCGANQRVIGGGCYSSGVALIQSVWLYEGIGFPEDEESWYNTSGGTGNLCGFTVSGNHTALALCCGT